MSEAEQLETKNKKSGEPESTGPSLILLYSLIALAIVVAVGLAAMIVFPFYVNRH